MPAAKKLDQLLDEARSHPFTGWDFGWLRSQGRLLETPLPWDYAKRVAERARTAHALLDLGTGGGELLASIHSIPRRTVATESYGPNVPVAARRLRPLGVEVVRTSGALDNNQQRSGAEPGRLPFRDGAFDLVVDRNEAYVPAEVARILRAGGEFVSEQSGSSEMPELCQLLDLPVPGSDDPSWDLGMAREQLRATGMTVVAAQEARIDLSLTDVGALVWYLWAVPWAAPGFSVDAQRERLEKLQREVERTGPIRVSRSAFWLEAKKP